MIALRFDGALRVLPAAVRLDAHNAVTLLPENAEKLFNTNGEGYYDPPTLRSLRWHLAVKQEGRYQVEIAYKRGPFSRIVDVQAGGNLLPTNVYGKEADSAEAGRAYLLQGDDVTVSIAPGSPALRGAKLDFEIKGVTLTYVGDK